MSHPRRWAAAIFAVLVAAGVAGCAAGGPTPSCGEFTLDHGESIPQEAVDCMSEGGVDDVLRVTVPTIEGDPIVTTYSKRSDGAIEVQTDATQDRYGGGTSLMLCPDAVSVVELGECEPQHEGD